jgi:hypothetical protein
MHMGDPSMMMLGGQHHSGISAKEEKDEDPLASYNPITTHDLMSNSAIGLSLNEGDDQEEDMEHAHFSVREFQDLPPFKSGLPPHAMEVQPEPAIPRLMQMQMEKYLFIYLLLIVVDCWLCLVC